jgi:hypothetical protein
MRKLILALAATAAFTSVAHADEWQHRHWEGGHREWHGNGGGNNWVAPMVGGLFIGGMLSQMRQNYVEQNFYEQQYQPVCRRQYVGNVVVDGQWVQAFRTVCN